MYEDGHPGELFITMAKEGSTVGGMMDAFGTAISVALQYGVPLEDLVNKFSHMRFEPMGHTTNPEIRIAKSVVDYIFRWMGIRFLPGYREAQIGTNDKPQIPSDEDLDADSQHRPAAMKAGGQKSGQGSTSTQARSASEGPGTPTRSVSEGHGKGNGHSNGTNGHSAKKVDPDQLERAGAKLRIDGNGPSVRSDQFARFQLDAPSCDNCGAITVRNGNCYLCHNCGNSMGCS